MGISLTGFAEQTVTLKMDGEGAKGSPVTLSASLTATPCAAGDPFVGVLSNAPRGGFAGVQVGGFVKASYTGTAPTPGYAVLAADGNGGVQAASSGQARLILEVDTTQQTVGFLL